jgi:hypothetical protein
MALWQGSSLNTNELATTTNHWTRKNLVPMVVKRNAFLHALTNEEAGPYGSIGSRVRYEKRARGNKLQVPLLGAIPSFSGLADSNQVDAVSLTWDSDAAGAATFEWAHYYHVEPVVHSEFTLMRGDDHKTLSWVEKVLKEKVVKGWEKTLGDAINGTAANSSRTAAGGWRYGASDGTSTGESSYATYGTLDRSDSGNADYRGNIQRLSDGLLTIDDFFALKVDIMADDGNPTFAVVGATGFKKMEKELRGQAMLPQKDWDAFAGDKLTCHGITICFESRCGETELGMFDPNALAIYLEEDGIDMEWEKAGGVYKGAKYVMPIHAWTAFIVECPSHTGKVTNILG